MVKVKLIDLGCFISDGNYSSKYPRNDEFVTEGIPFIRCNNFKNNTITKEDMYYITKEKHEILLKGHVKEGDILVTTRGSLGQVTIVPAEYEDANINAQIVLLRVDKEKLYNRYLMWQLKSPNIQNQIAKNKTGTALQQLPISRLKRIEFFIERDIDKQIKIADNLDKVQEMIDIRKKQIEQLDELIKSQFVEMFGTPFNNDKWDIKKLGEMANSISDGSNVNPKYYQDSGEVLFLRIQNVWRNEFRLEDSVYISKEINKKYLDTSLHTGDLLISKIGRYYTKDSSLGRVSIYIGKNDRANYSNNVMRVRLKSEYNSEFINIILNLDDYQKHIRRESKGGTDKRALSKKVIEGFPIINPPIEIQTKYIKFVKQIDKQKIEMKKNLEEMKKLQESLINKYFG